MPLDELRRASKAPPKAPASGWTGRAGTVDAAVLVDYLTAEKAIRCADDEPAARSP